MMQPVVPARRSLGARLKRELRSHWMLYLMVTPAVLGFLVFRYFPIYGIVMAFQRFDVVDGFWGSQFVGLDNFRAFIGSVFFGRLMRNTFLLGFYNLIFGFPAPIILAVLLNEVRSSKFKRTVQTISYLPHFIPTVVLVGVMYELFGGYGIVNGLLESLGLETQRFFTDNRWFRTLYVGSGIWQSIGWNSIIFVGALSAIDPSLYDAATIDGANRWQRIRFISLPSITPILSTMFILQCGKVMNIGFAKVLLMYGPATYETADILSTYAYRRGLIGADYSFGAAVDLFSNVMCLALVLLSNYVSRKMGEDGVL